MTALRKPQGNVDGGESGAYQQQRLGLVNVAKREFLLRG
jgi:hypothetical protein